MAYTPEQIQRAMRAAQAAGDEAAVADLRARLTEAYQAEVPSAVEGMSGPQRFAAGMGQGAVNIGRQLGNIVGLKSDEELQDAAGLDRALLETGAGRAGSMAGEIAATLPLGGVVGAAGKQVAARAAPGLVKTLARAAPTVGVGAAEGALTAGPDQRGTGALIGGAAGGALPWALKRLGNPVAATDEARRLMQEGVDLTPGQMNPRSVLGTIEEYGSKFPFISNARERAQQQAVKATLRKGAAPGSDLAGRGLDDLPANPEDLMEEVIGSYGSAYGQFKDMPIYPRQMNTAGPDVPLRSFPQRQGALAAAAGTRDISADVASREAALDFMENQLTRLPHSDPTRTLKFQELQELRSKLRAEARRLAGSATGADRGELIRRGADEVSGVLGSQMSAADKAALDAIDAQYRQAMILDDAMRRAGGREGGFTFSQGMQALRKPEGAAFGRGGTGEPVSELMRAGKRVFDERTPATGVRAMLPLAMGALVGAKPAAIIGAGVGALASSPGGRRVLGGQTVPQQAYEKARQQIMAQIPTIGEPMLSQLASQLANQYAME